MLDAVAAKLWQIPTVVRVLHFAETKIFYPTLFSAFSKYGYVAYADICLRKYKFKLLCQLDLVQVQVQV